MDFRPQKSRLGALIDRFRKDRTGSVAMTTGLVVGTLFVAAGGAIDYTNTVTVKQKAQRAMDATVLALARRNVADADLQTEGAHIFNGILAENGLAATVSEMVFTPNGTSVRGAAVVTANTMFLGLAGLDTLKGAVRAEATPPSRRPIEISLVLDVSGSMSEDLNGEPRIDRMKDAVNSMLTTLDDNLPSDADVSVALVPYSTSVNVKGFTNALENASAKDGLPKPPYGEDVWAAERAVTASGMVFTVNDDSPVSRPVPFVTGDEMTWVDGSGNTHVSDQPSFGITPLTSDRYEITSAIADFEPNGWTAGHIGMAWGVYSLSSKWASVWPNDPKPLGDADKIIVFLSDGEFNTTHAIGAQSTDDGATSYAYFDSVCDLARTDGIVVYTIALNLDVASATALGNCVSNGGEAYTPDTASELDNAFKDIALSLGHLRLSS